MRHVDGKHPRPTFTPETLVGRIALLFLTFLLTSCGGSSDASVAPVRPLGNDASLSSLSVGGIDLDPAFHSSVTEYTASVGFAAKSTQVAAVAADGNATVSVNGTSVPSGAASDPIALDEGSNTITINVIAADGSTTKTYTVVVTRQSASDFAQTAYVKASNTDQGDEFGYSVALSGDSSTLVVGARREDSAATGVNGDETDRNAEQAGAAYVFTRDSAGGWSQQAYIKASNSGAGDWFGESIAISANGGTLAVGAPTEDSAATGVNGDETDNGAGASGAAYVFTRSSGNVWIQRAYIKASNTELGDLFGEAVALSNDGTTLAVGARKEDSSATGVNGDETDNNATDSGAVYVFTRDSGGAWTQQAYIKASNTGGGYYCCEIGGDQDLIGQDYFGVDVSLSGDGATLAVGASLEDSAATGVGGDETDNAAHASGAVYIFTRDNDNQWSQQAYIKASNTDESDRFGEVVTLSDDGATLAVGATKEDSAATGINGDEGDNTATISGAVYVFIRDNAGVWNQQAYIKASNAERGDRFGKGNVLSADGASLAVGSEDDSAATGVNGDETDNSAPYSGAVYMYTRDSIGTWSQRAYTKASNAEDFDNFGWAVALSADGATLAVGAFGESSTATGVNGDETDNTAAWAAGAVYLFEL